MTRARIGGTYTRKIAAVTDRDKIVEARMKLRARFQAESHATPSMADPTPLGSGPPNRHGMPRLPVDQTETTKWPVLDLGAEPAISKAKWQLVVDGACERPFSLEWAAFESLEQVDDVNDFHNVTKWSRFDILWRGVRVAGGGARAGPGPGARRGGGRAGGGGAAGT